MIETIRQGLKQDGFDVSISKLCRWFEIPRRAVYYKPTKAPAKVQNPIVQLLKETIEKNWSFGYRTVAYLLEFHKTTVQRIFQHKGWQGYKRPVGMHARVYRSAIGG
jgi:putative transposase